MIRKILISQFMTHLIILLIVSSIAIIICSYSQSRIRTRPLHLAWNFDVQLVLHFCATDIIDTSNHELLRSGVLLLFNLIWLTKLILSMDFEGNLDEKKGFHRDLGIGLFPLGPVGNHPELPSNCISMPWQRVLHHSTGICMASTSSHMLQKM